MRKSMKKALTFVLSAAIAATMIAVPVMAEAEETDSVVLERGVASRLTMTALRRLLLLITAIRPQLFQSSAHRMTNQESSLMLDMFQ